MLTRLSLGASRLECRKVRVTMNGGATQPSLVGEIEQPLYLTRSDDTNARSHS